jgi:hypothetical protein
VKPIVLLRRHFRKVMGFAPLYPSYGSNKPEMTDRPPRRDGLGGGDDGADGDAADRAQ